MCRGQLPVWQREWPLLRTAGASFVTVAADAELELARRFAAPHDFPTLVDTTNQLARILRYRAIPNGYLFSKDGTLLDEQVTSFDLAREPEATRALVRGWLGTALRVEPAAARPGMDTSEPRALDLFARGDAELARGERQRGLALWHAAYVADPKSFVVRKQIWRALYPERFGDPIDLAWQREQIAREDSIGFSAANPSLPLVDP